MSAFGGKADMSHRIANWLYLKISPKIPASLAWQCRSNEGGVSVTKKSADRCWIAQPVYRWVSCGAIVCGYRFTRRNWKYSCRSTNIPRTMVADILGLLH